MRASNLDEIAAILDRADEPLTAKQIIAATSMSSHTVTVALAQLGAISDNKWPKGWSKPRASVDSMKSIAPETASDVVLVELRRKQPTESWAPRWEHVRPNFIVQVMGLNITKDDDPKELAETFAAGASVLASFAAAIQRVQNDPDWYAKLNSHDG